MIQKEYRKVIKEALLLAKDYFKSRLKAIYVCGSVATGEACPGVSDIDSFLILTSDATDDDIQWLKKNELHLSGLFPDVANDIHLTPLSIKLLKNENNLYKFFLKYASKRIYGDDVFVELEAEGISTPAPSKELVKSRLAFMEKNIMSILDGTFPKTLGSLPDDTYFATRKLARGLLFDSAWLLIACERFASFKAGTVLNSLKTDFPEWQELYRMIEKILTDAQAANISPDCFIRSSKDYYLWLLNKIKINQIESEK